MLVVRRLEVAAIGTIADERLVAATQVLAQAAQHRLAHLGIALGFVEVAADHVAAVAEAHHRHGAGCNDIGQHLPGSDRGQLVDVANDQKGGSVGHRPHECLHQHVMIDGNDAILPNSEGDAAMAERSDEQAKPALTDYNQAVQEAVSSFDQWIETTQVGAQGISKKAMKFAQRNALSAFDFTQKIVQAKDIDEVVRMQTEFVQWQVQVLSEQVKDLGEAVANATEAATKQGQ